MDASVSSMAESANHLLSAVTEGHSSTSSALSQHTSAGTHSNSTSKTANNSSGNYSGGGGSSSTSNSKKRSSKSTRSTGPSLDSDTRGICHTNKTAYLMRFA